MANKREAKKTGGNQSRKIRDEVAALTLAELVKESKEWLQVVKANPPKGWKPEVLKDQERLLKELWALAVTVKTEANPRYGRIKERLAGYCERLRGRHAGKSPGELRQ